MFVIDALNFTTCTYNQILVYFLLQCCLICSGYYCPGPGETSYTQYPCPTGHYCLQGTTVSTQFPCAGGSYNPEQNSTSDTACLPCPSAKYCPKGTSDTGIDCPRGFYCTGGQSSGFQHPCPVGTYGPDLGFDSMSFLLKIYFHCFTVTYFLQRNLIYKISSIFCSLGTLYSIIIILCNQLARI